MKTCSIIGGVDGAGKTSLVGILSTEIATLGKVVDTDMINETNGEDPLKIVDDCLKKNICFTLISTLSGHDIVTTVRKAVKQGYYVKLYYIGLDTFEESIKRIKNRVSKGGRNVSTIKLRCGFETRFEDIATVLPFCNEAIFYDNENGFSPVAKYQNGEFWFIGNDTPNWMSDLVKHLSFR